MAEDRFWERLAARSRAWAERHEVAVRRLRLARAIWLWASLAWLLVLLVLRPSLRESLEIFVQVYWLLLVWFFLTRTRTVSWRLVAGVFSVGLAWSAVIGWLLHGLSQDALAKHFGSLTLPGQVRALGPMTAIAGVGEEALKLVPLAALAVAMPARVRRFAVTDWLLLGFASGLAFQAFEELVRRTAAHVLRPGLLDILFGTDNRGPASGYAQYGLGPAGGWSQWTKGTEFPGHHATTALVAVTIGLGIAAWRHARRSGGPAAIGWRALAVGAPLVMWWLVMAVHAGGNATVSVRDRWLDAEHPSVPWAIRAGWQVAFHGIGLRWLLLVLLLVALLVDARHLRAGDRTRADGGLLRLPFDPGARADGWADRIVTSGPARPFVAAAAALAAYATRDVAALLAAHARQGDEPRLRAVLRGRAAGGMLRAVREETLAAAAGPGTPWRARLLAAGGLAALVLATFWLAPSWAARIGTTPELPDADWLAGLLDSLATWWDGQGAGTKIAIAVGIAAVIALSGGSLGLAFGISGVATYLLEHGHGAADFTRDPAAATRSYLSTATPGGVLLDGGEFLLTFGPWNFAGAAAGRGVRIVAEDFARDPQAWWAAQRALARDDRGAIDLAAFFRREPIELADGTMLPTVDPADAEAFARWWRSGKESPIKATGAPGRYQVRLYGPVEHRVSVDPEVWPDGITPEYGAIADAKYRVAIDGSSFHDPASLPAGIREKAVQQIDIRLLKYRTVLQDEGNPAGVLEIATNDLDVARYVEERMRALGIRGYVRLQP